MADGGHQVVAAVGNAGDLLVVIDGHQPAITAVDVRMPPGYTDEDLLAAIADHRPATPDLTVLAVSRQSVMLVEQLRGAPGQVLWRKVRPSGYVVETHRRTVL